MEPTNEIIIYEVIEILDDIAYSIEDRTHLADAFVIMLNENFCKQINYACTYVLDDYSAPDFLEFIKECTYLIVNYNRHDLEDRARVKYIKSKLISFVELLVQLKQLM